MIPDYTKEVQGVVQQWYDAAEKDLGNDETKQLYQKTDQLVKTFQELKNSGQIEKVKGLSNILVQNFNDHSVGESELLAQWAARKDGYWNLHELFQFVADIHDYPQAFTTDYDNSPMASYLSSIIHVDAAALSYLKPVIPKISEMEKTIISKLDINSLILFGQASKHQNQLVKSHLVDFLNNGEITIQDLGLNSVKEITDYFGEDNCKKITRLDLTNVYKKIKSYDENYHMMLEKYSTEMEEMNISESFPNLKHFILSDYVPEKKFSISDLHLPSNLESLSLTECKVISYKSVQSSISDLSAIKELKSLKTLNISNNDLKDEDIAFLKELSSLKEINFSKNSIKDSDLLLNNKGLVSLDMRNTLIADLSFVENFTLLEAICFGHHNFTSDSLNPSLFANIKVLEKCESLTSLDIYPLTVEKEFDGLKLPNLSHLACMYMRNVDFFSDCTSLRSLECGMQEDLSFFKMRPEITKLVLRNNFAGDLKNVTSLKNLEEIELISFYDLNLSELEKIPSLKKVILNRSSINPSDQMLNKEITIEIKP
jgi:Leucine-rich repeat (LRR) protein